MAEIVSVIVPMKNAARYVGGCLQSILAQNAAPIEVIVIDDKSTDDSCAIVSNIRDDRLKILGGPGTGIADCLNTGLRAATGSIVMRCDADDIFPEGRIKQQADWLSANRDFDAVCGGFSAMDGRGRHVLDYECGGNEPVEITDELRKGTTRTHLCTFAIRSSLIERAGTFRSFFKMGEDIDYQYRLAENGRVFFQPEIRYQYRIHSESITHNHNQDERHYYEDMARALQIQRRVTNIGDILERGHVPKMPESLLNKSDHSKRKSHSMT